MLLNNLKEKSLKIFIVLISVIFWLINYYRYKDYPQIFRVAKGFGLNLRIWIMFMYFTMCRSLLHGKIENHVSYHKFLGYIIIISTIGHSLCHIIYNKNMTDLTHITGYVLTSIISLIFLSYLLRNYNYSIFKIIHMLYFPFLFICMLHMKIYWYYFALPIVVYSIEILCNFNKMQISDISNGKTIENISGNSVIYLSLPRKIESVPGSYYYICIPHLGILEWHPFSISISSFLDQLVFLIEVKGDWTNKLYNLLKNNNNKIKIIVMGPYYTSSTNILKCNVKNKIAISTGIGITPFLSNIDTTIDSFYINRKHRDDFFNIFGTDFKQNKVYSLITSKDLENINYKNQNLTVIWIFRDLKGVKNLFDFIKTIMEDSYNVNLKIYITSKEYNDESRQKFIDDNRVNGIEISFGRPSLKELFKDNPSEIFYCGNPSMKSLIKDYCYFNSIKFNSEVFG